MGGRERRAWRAASLAERAARRWEGAYNGEGPVGGFLAPDEGSGVSASTSFPSSCRAVAVEAFRLLDTVRRWHCHCVCVIYCRCCSVSRRRGRVVVSWEKAQRWTCNRGLRGGWSCDAHRSRRTRFIDTVKYGMRQDRSVMSVVKVSSQISSIIIARDHHLDDSR